MTTETPARQRLDRRRVLEAAIEVIDQEGLDALTMRRLAEELDVDPMTVHHHAKGKDNLLDGVAELLWEEIERPGRTDDPTEVLRTLAHSVRDLFHRHPEAAPLVLRCTVLPRSELELWRAYLDGLAAAGLDQPAAVLRSVLTYALGASYAEVAWLGVACQPGKNYTDREVLLSLGQAVPQGTPPELAAAAVDVIADCDPDLCFHDGLELMLAGLAMRGER
ncbi:MAG: TetR family transcriptional regulator [Acidimicrobiia bacterium]|nr:TetR family transcriptional regulator [Acidimicrobiia bacterium]